MFRVGIRRNDDATVRSLRGSANRGQGVRHLRESCGSRTNRAGRTQADVIGSEVMRAEAIAVRRARVNLGGPKAAGGQSSQVLGRPTGTVDCDEVGPQDLLRGSPWPEL
jgi:hypothetical protein